MPALVSYLGVHVHRVILIPWERRPMSGEPRTTNWREVQLHSSSTSAHKAL